MIKVLDGYIESYAAALRGFDDLRDLHRHGGEKASQQKCLMILLSMRNHYLLRTYETEKGHNKAAASNLRVLVMTQAKFNQMISQGEAPFFEAKHGAHARGR